MTDKINGRTLEEIKKGLEVCKKQAECKQCGYFHSHPVDENCVEILLNDALALFQQLEARIDTLIVKAVLFDDAVAVGEKMKRERDAAVKDLKSVVASNYFDGDYCKLCKYNEPDGQCHHDCIPYSSEWGWEWRGVQEVEN